MVKWRPIYLNRFFIELNLQGVRSMGNSHSVIKPERVQTDKSLNSERGKTDESLLEVRKKSELKTDKTLQSDRDEADAARNKRRSDTDIDIKEIRENKSKSADQVKLEALTDDVLNQQRKSNDVAVEDERSRIDILIQTERSQTEAVLAISLARERNQTDENLSSERDKADSEFDESSHQLESEKLSHSMTKAEVATRDELLAIVSHDLKNPIGAVLSFAELLSEESSVAGISAEAKNWIEVIKRNAVTSLRLIGDILDMERFAEGKLHLQLKDQNIHNLIQQSVESFKQSALEKKIKFNNLVSTTGSHVHCDGERVAQVLSNLLGNAIKFSPVNGTIQIQVQKLDKEILVSVTDCGPGIPQAQRSRIFERYAQLQNKDRRGLGLGLYISKMLIESHGGHLWVSAAERAGSTFNFTLPMLN